MVVEFGILVGGDDERWAACLANLRGELNLDTSDRGEDWVLIFFSSSGMIGGWWIRQYREHGQYSIREEDEKSPTICKTMVESTAPPVECCMLR